MLLSIIVASQYFIILFHFQNKTVAFSGWVHCLLYEKCLASIDQKIHVSHPRYQFLERKND